MKDNVKENTKGIKFVYVSQVPCPICGDINPDVLNVSHFYDPLYGSCVTINKDGWEKYNKERQEYIMRREQEEKIETAWKNGYKSGEKNKSQEMIGALIVGIIIGMIIMMVLTK